MIFRNKKFLVYGLGKSGIGAIHLLKKLRAKVFYFDDNVKTDYFEGVKRLDFVPENLSQIEYIVLNPSVSKYSENLILADIMGIKIISEIELAFYAKKGKIISVTGSNGKSTTSTLISHILQVSQIQNELVGNIGISFCEKVCERKKNNFVVEVSSFQLETTKKYHSNIACFLNFTENHLDRHFSLKEYFETKKKIFDNQTKKDYAILNFDDAKVKEIQTNSQVYYFSKNVKVEGTYVLDGQIYFASKGNIEKILDVCDINLRGDHNLENVLCAVLVCKLFGMDNQAIKSGVSSFYGINHRIEYVDEIDNIDFYNDSKSTTVRATQTALECFRNKKILLILGGSRKNIDYDPLFQTLPQCVKEVLAVGEIRDEIYCSAQKNHFSNISICENLQKSIRVALSLARAKNLDVVLLSPATASFDEFKNFEERGDTFKKIVKELKNEN